MLCQFLIELFCNRFFFFLAFLDASTLSDLWFANIFSHSVMCLFTYLMMTFEAPYQYF